MHTLPNGQLVEIWRDRLAGLGFSTSIDDLRAAAGSEAPDARGMAFMLIALGGHEEALAEVLAGLDDTYPPARAEAARAALMLKHRDAITTLHGLLDSDWPETALNAAAYLADFGDRRGWPVLAAAATGEVEALRLQAALLARAFIGWSKPGGEMDVVALLVKAAEHDDSGLVRRSALWQLVGLESTVLSVKERRRLVRQALDDRDPQVVQVAKMHLEELGD